jgi:hypothetical protein
MASWIEVTIFREAAEVQPSDSALRELKCATPATPPPPRGAPGTPAVPGRVPVPLVGVSGAPGGAVWRYS